MAVKLVSSQNIAQVSNAFVNELGQSLEEHGKACVCFSSFEEGFLFQKAISKKGIGLGVGVATLSSWVSSLWRVYGDERELIDANDIVLILNQLITSSPQDELVTATSGSLQFCADLISNHLSEMLLPDALQVDPSCLGEDELSVGNARLLRTVEAFVEYAREHKLVVLSVAAQVLVQEIQCLHSVIEPVWVVEKTAFFDWELTFLFELSKITDVTFVYELLNTPAYDLVENLISTIKSAATNFDVICTEEVWSSETELVRNPELSKLSQRLFVSDATPVTPTGAVSLAKAMGPSAEAELLSQVVDRLVEAGDMRIALATSESFDLWKALVPKLKARNISCTGYLSVALKNTPIYSVLLNYLNCIAQILEIHNTSEKSDETPSLLGDMSFWPPRSISDFLLSSLSDVNFAQAFEIDKKLRSDRLLTASVLLTDLKKQKKFGEVVSTSVGYLQEGKVAKALEVIRQAYAKRTGVKKATGSELLEDVLITGVLDAWVAGASFVEAFEHKKDASPTSLKDMIELLDKMLKTKSLVFSIEHVCENPKAHVTLSSAEYLSKREAVSFDAAVVAGLNTSRMPIAQTDTLYNLVVEHFAFIQPTNPLEQARYTFKKLIDRAKHHVVLQNRAYNRTTKEVEEYNAVVLSDLLGAYGYRDSKDNILVEQINSEFFIAKNMNESTEDPEVTGEFALQDVTQGVRSEAKDLVMLPAMLSSQTCANKDEASSDTEQHEAFLMSASQVETYLACPYKWFVERRLALKSFDAGIGPLEKGTFVHSVFENFYIHLCAKNLGMSQKEAQEYIKNLPADKTLLPFDFKDELDAKEAEFSEVFDTVYKSQFNAKEKLQQRLVPHNPIEEYQITPIKTQVWREIVWEKSFLKGFVPWKFELKFGPKDIPVEYAGMQFVGSIDRVDIDKDGNAIIVDYKYKKPTTSGDYTFKKKLSDEVPEIPYHVQSLIYAQVLRKLYPELKVRGALYVFAQAPYDLVGAIDGEFASRIFGNEVERKMHLASICPEDRTFYERLDACEDALSAVFERMKQGDITPNPCDSSVCEYCKAVYCPLRTATN